jgi:NADH dehydrogenase FAD-containing subunit
MAKTVLVLGANYAGVPIAQHLLKYTLPKVPGMKVILVSPNTHMYWHNATIRAILPDMLSDDKILYPIAPAFKKYSASQFEFVVAKAEKLDPETKTVHISTGRSINYDVLVIATGSSFKGGMPFKHLSTTEETRNTLHEWSKKIGNAESIVVAGGGATGVELAGELGQEYASNGTKKVTFIVDGDEPLHPRFMTSMRKDVKRSLEKLGVKVVTNTRVTSVTDSTKGKGGKMLELTGTKDSKKSKLYADVYLPTFGTAPNTDYVPEEMLDGDRRVRQTTYLRAEGYDDIFVAGDAGNLQAPNGKITDDQVIHIVKGLQAYLTGAELPKYQPVEKTIIAVTTGRKGGSGQMGNMKIWSFLVWFLKGRYLGTDYASQYVAGARTIQGSW